MGSTRMTRKVLESALNRQPPKRSRHASSRAKKMFLQAWRCHCTRSNQNSKMKQLVFANFESASSHQYPKQPKSQAGNQRASREEHGESAPARDATARIDLGR